MKTKLLSALLALSAIINAQTWSPVGMGIANGYVQALAVYNGALYAGGSFTTAVGGNSAKYIAKWDGTTWSAVGTGMDRGVEALSVYNGDLYAGGYFTK